MDWWVYSTSESDHLRNLEWGSKFITNDKLWHDDKWQIIMMSILWFLGRELTLNSVHRYQYFCRAKNVSHRSSLSIECCNWQLHQNILRHCHIIWCNPYSMGESAEIAIDFCSHRPPTLRSRLALHNNIFYCQFNTGDSLMRPKSESFIV